MTDEEFWSALDGIAHRHRPEGYHYCDPLGKAMVPLLRQAEEEDLSLLCAAVPAGPSTQSGTPVTHLYHGDAQDMWYLCFTSPETGVRLLRESLHSPAGAPLAQVFLVRIRDVLKSFDRPEVSGFFFNFMDRSWVSVPKSLIHRRWKKRRTGARTAGKAGSGKKRNRQPPRKSRPRPES